MIYYAIAPALQDNDIESISSDHRTDTSHLPIVHALNCHDFVFMQEVMASKWNYLEGDMPPYCVERLQKLVTDALDFAHSHSCDVGKEIEYGVDELIRFEICSFGRFMTLGLLIADLANSGLMFFLDAYPESFPESTISAGIHQLWLLDDYLNWIRDVSLDVNRCVDFCEAGVKHAIRNS